MLWCKCVIMFWWVGLAEIKDSTQSWQFLVILAAYEYIGPNAAYVCINKLINNFLVLLLCVYTKWPIQELEA